MCKSLLEPKPKHLTAATSTTKSAWNLKSVVGSNREVPVLKNLESQLSLQHEHIGAEFVIAMTKYLTNTT